MEFNTKFFIKDRIKELLEDLKKPIFWMFIISIVVVLILLKSNLSFKQKAIIYVLAIILIIGLNEYFRYMAGEWKHRQREEMGIPSKSDIRELKKLQENNVHPVKPQT